MRPNQPTAPARRAGSFPPTTIFFEKNWKNLKSSKIQLNQKFTSKLTFLGQKGDRFFWIQVITGQTCSFFLENIFLQCGADSTHYQTFSKCELAKNNYANHVNRHENLCESMRTGAKINANRKHTLLSVTLKNMRTGVNRQENIM